MEKSERFRSPQITAETMQKQQKSEAQLYKFDIVTYYSPAALHAAHTSNREGF